MKVCFEGKYFYPLQPSSHIPIKNKLISPTSIIEINKNSINRDNIYCIEGMEILYIINIIIDIVYEAD